jgi:hypothetical protein
MIGCARSISDGLFGKRMRRIPAFAPSENGAHYIDLLNKISK